MVRGIAVYIKTDRKLRRHHLGVCVAVLLAYHWLPIEPDDTCYKRLAAVLLASIFTDKDRAERTLQGERIADQTTSAVKRKKNFERISAGGAAGCGDATLKVLD
jgi:hypothetical protein